MDPGNSCSRPSQLFGSGLLQATVCQADSTTQPNPALLLIPIWEVGPKKKYVYIWQCCSCGHSGINITVATCPVCEAARCAYCQTTKIQVTYATCVQADVPNTLNQIDFSSRRPEESDPSSIVGSLAIVLATAILYDPVPFYGLRSEMDKKMNSHTDRYSNVNQVERSRNKMIQKTSKRKGTRTKSVIAGNSKAKMRNPRKFVVPVKIKQYLLQLIEESLPLTSIGIKCFEVEKSIPDFYEKKWPSEFSTDRCFKEDSSYVDRKREDDIVAHGNEFGIFLQDTDDGIPSCEVNEVVEFCQSALAANLKMGIGTAGLRRAIWLDDRCTPVSPNSQNVREYKNPLTATGLYRLLRAPRFDNTEAPDANKRLIYLENLDPYCILALAETASFHQVSALRDAIWKHLALQCSIQVKIPGRAFPIFQMEFNVPYFALRAFPPPKIYRRGAIRTSPPRKWRDVAFLKIPPKGSHEQSTYGIHEAHISFVICGSDNSRWTGYALVDNISDDDNLGDETFSYKGLQGDPISSGILDSNLPIWDPREYFLAIVEIRMGQILKEWKYLIRTVECSIDNYKIRHPSSLSRHSRGACGRAKDIKKTFDWTQQAMELLSQLRNRLSETLKTFTTFSSPKGDINYFLHSSPNVSQRGIEWSRRTILDIVEELQFLQQQLLLLEKSCLSSAQALQLRLTLEGNEAVQHSGRATELTVTILTPFAVATGYFTMPQSVIPFTPNLKTFLIATMAIMFMVRVILFALPRLSWWWKKSRAWAKILHIDGWGPPCSAIEYVSRLSGRPRCDHSDNAMEAVNVATLGV